VLGIFISGTFFFYFVQNAQRLVQARYSAALLFGAGCLIVLVGVALGLVNKNTISGIATYFFLSAAVIRVAKGGPLIVTVFQTSLLLALLGGLFLDHRLMIGAGLTMLGVVVLLRLIPLAALRNVTLIAVFGGVLLMIVLFAGLWGFDIRDYDTLAIEYTGRTARSGRQIIWPLIISQTAKSPWIGLGTGTTFSDFYDATWSAHSYFLQIYMQAGIIGVTALVLLLFSIWAAIGRPRISQPVSIIATGSFVFLIMHISFEVFLMQVNLLMGCGAWMMLGLCVGSIRNRARQDINQPRFRETDRISSIADAGDHS
jgi:hypothetical protein